MNDNSTVWLCAAFAAACLGAVLAWQKRSKLARWAAGHLLGYADAVDCRKRAVKRWHQTITGGIEEEIRETAGRRP